MIEKDKLDQADSEHGGAVLNDNKRKSIRIVSLWKVRAREGTENNIWKHSDNKHHKVRGLRRWSKVWPFLF